MQGFVCEGVVGEDVVKLPERVILSLLLCRVSCGRGWWGRTWSSCWRGPYSGTQIWILRYADQIEMLKRLHCKKRVDQMTMLKRLFAKKHTDLRNMLKRLCHEKRVDQMNIARPKWTLLPTLL